jgi:hypothetical protein
MKCKVFKESVGWSDVMFIFSEEIKFKEILNNKQTSFLCKDNYIGEFEFDVNFLKILNNKFINDKPYWFEYIYEYNV